MSRRWHKLLFAAYCLLMLWLLFGQRIGQENGAVVQLRPLTTLRLQLSVLLRHRDASLRMWALRNLAGNVVLFVPLGFFVPWLGKRWRCFWRQGLLMMGLILAVELLQITFGLGTCDVDDLILNLCGTTVGYFLWKWLLKSGNCGECD